MGSQSVTNFPALKKQRMRALLKDYSPESPRAVEQANEIGAMAVGTLGKGPARNEFAQALSSRSVETALGLIMALARELKQNPQRVYEESGVGDKTQPTVSISAFLTRALSGMLSETQAETESAFAARDAIPKTLIDVVSRAFPREREPVEVDRKKFAEAFQKVQSKEIANVFFQNVAGALINQVLDATRGSLPPARIAELKQRIREQYVPELIEEIMKAK